MNSRVQEIWLRLLGPANSSQIVRVEEIEKGYYAVVREAADPSSGATGRKDFEAAIPNLACTRSVYLNQGDAYGLASAESLRDWAGPLAGQVERGASSAFAIVDLEAFAREVSASLRAAGWEVEQEQDSLRVNEGRFRENASLLRAIVHMVLTRSTFVEAALTLKAELRERFSVDAQLFSRFAERFAKYQPGVFDHYFTAYPQCSCLAAGWDYWQAAGCGAQEAAEVFEEAMKEFESVLATSSEDWFQVLSPACCELGTTEN